MEAWDRCVENVAQSRELMDRAELLLTLPYLQRPTDFSLQVDGDPSMYKSMLQAEFSAHMEAFYELGRGGRMAGRRRDVGRSNSNYEANKSRM